MRRQPLPASLADRIRCHLHFRVTPRLIGHWRRVAQALSRQPDRFRFYHPGYDQFDLRMEETVMVFLERCGYDPLVPDAHQLQWAERLLWQFWEKNVHLQRWTRRVAPLSLEQKLEVHGDAVLEQARNVWGFFGDDSGQPTDNYWREWLFHALSHEGWPVPKVTAVVLHVFDEWDYEMLSEHLKRVYHLSVKTATLRKWVSRDLKQAGQKIWKESGEHMASSHSADHAAGRRDTSINPLPRPPTDTPLEPNFATCHEPISHRHSYNQRKEPNVAAENPLPPGGRRAS